MLDLYGASYIIDHCKSELEKELRKEQLEYYVTDALYLIGMNIASITRGKYIAKSWRELCNTNKIEQKQKTGDEIAESVVRAAGLSFGD